MPRYRFVFINDRDRAFEKQDRECDDDLDALDVAYGFCHMATIEVTNAGRLLCRVEKGSKPPTEAGGGQPQHPL